MNFIMTDSGYIARDYLALLFHFRNGGRMLQYKESKD